MNFPLFLALKYLRPRRDFVSVIPIITTLGVCLGVAILMIVLAVMSGYGEVWREKILGFKPHITVRGYWNTIDDPDSAVAKIEKIPGVKSATAAIITPVMLALDIDADDPPISQAVIIGVDPGRESILSQLDNQIVSGRYDISGDNVVLGLKLARSLGARAGDSILCYSPRNLNTKNELHLPEEMVVAGLYQTGQNDYDSSFLICSLGMARDVLGMDGGATLIQAQLDDPMWAEREKLVIAHALGPMFFVTSWQEEDQTLFDVIRMEKTMMFILLAFIAVVAAFCVTNTLILITIQKTREIGLLKALGFSKWQIESAFVLNGMIQCVAGILLGLGLGWTVLCNLNRIVNWLAGVLGRDLFPPHIYGFDEMPWRVLPSDIGSVVGLVFVFCVLAAYLPAMRAARLDPVKAIND